MKLRPIRHRTFLLLHAGLLCAVLLFPLYRYMAELLPPALTGCMLHDRFLIYCPVCGGTRAVAALLRFDLYGALCANAFVTCLILLFLAVDIIAWVRYFKHKNPQFKISPWVWVSLAIAMLLWTVARNALMITVGFDPTGDLVSFWNAVRGA